jgi:glycosyltransferase involved in cell wall biosynthesis
MKSSKSSTPLSVVVPTLNNQIDIEQLLKNVRDQDYPQDKIEIIISDGGSVDKTLSIAKKYKSRIYHNAKTLAEPGVNLGISMSTGDLIMILAADNRFPSPESITKIISSFNNPKIVAAFPKHDSDDSDTLFTKYINTFTDPFNHFMYGDASNARTFKNIYKLIDTNQTYTIYDYQASSIKPMLAFAQGFTFRSGYRRDGSDEFDDIVPIQKMINDGKQIAYVHSVSLIHHTIRDCNHFIRKSKWATQNAVNGESYGISHRQNYLSIGQKLKFLAWPIYAIFFPFGIIRSLMMLFLTREKMWLFSPIISFISAYSSISAVLEVKLNKNTKLKRQ